MIPHPINVLLLEDLKNDAELIKRQVLKIAPSAIFTVAANREEFYNKLDWVTPDAVLADYRLQDFNGLEALLFLKEKMPYVPFIFITGTLNDEEKAAEAILKGASGYILKENMNTLPEKLAGILEKEQKSKADLIEHERKRRAARLALQKAHALMEKLSDFEKKSEFQELLDSLKEGLNGTS